ncbi:MAG: hypothetical protein KGM47_09695, partial [Acidobacteriota bacterium]|nr:hypothetical protein [Acidobacteriota bacterium]
MQGDYLVKLAKMHSRRQKVKQKTKMALMREAKTYEKSLPPACFPERQARLPRSQIVLHKVSVFILANRFETLETDEKDETKNRGA